jgi:hypothetical protein
LWRWLLLLAAGCSSGSNGNDQAQQAARCTRAVDKAASSSDKQPTTVRYALILVACKTKAMLESAVAGEVGKNQVATTVGEIAIACLDIHPAPKVCAQLGRG